MFLRFHLTDAVLDSCWSNGGRLPRGWCSVWKCLFV